MRAPTVKIWYFPPLFAATLVTSFWPHQQSISSQLFLMHQFQFGMKNMIWTLGQGGSHFALQIVAAFSVALGAKQQQINPI